MVVALGVGLLIGAERERRKLERGEPSAAGIRTFTVATLAGAISLIVGGVALLAIATASTAVLAALSYWRTRREGDPGVTTEIALILAVLVGALAVREPMGAAAVGVIVAILLAARTPLHHFVGKVLTQDEVRGALILAGATLVILPLAPDRAMGPYGALNPRSIWLVVILLLGISAAGHVAIRTLGVRFGLPVAGLAAGFVSSSAAIGAMSARAAKTPAVLSGAVAGAVLSTVATIVQLVVLIGAISRPTLQTMAFPLICAGVVACIYGAVFTIKALRIPPADERADPGQAFSVSSALTFALLLSVILVLAAALGARFGDAGATVAAAAAGLVDTHAAAISIASLAAAGQIEPHAAVLPILAGLTTNTVTKIIFALSGGRREFAWRVIPGLLLVAAAAWLGAAVQGWVVH